jgi:hypothetical protein
VFGLPGRLAQLGSWVSMWSPHVAVVTQHSFDANSAERLHLLGIELVCDEVTGLIHKDDRLVAVSTESGAEIPCAAWIATRLTPTSNLAATWMKPVSPKLMSMGARTGQASLRLEARAIP